MTLETIPSQEIEVLRALRALRPEPVLSGLDKIRRALAMVDAVLLAEAVINPLPMLWRVREDLREGLAEVTE